MTVKTEERPKSSPAPEWHSWSRRTWLLIVASASLTVLVVTTSTILFLTRDRSLHMFGGGIHDELGATRPPGETLFLHVAGNAGVVVDVDDVRPIAVRNTSDAQLQVVLCRDRRYGDGVGTASRKNLAKTCSATVRFASGRYRLQEAATSEADTFNEILLAVTPSHRGTVQVDGIQIRYRKGDRAGDELSGSRVTVLTP